MVGILIIAKCDAMVAIVYRLRMTAPTFAFQRHATHARAGGPRPWENRSPRATLAKERTGGTAAKNIRKRTRHHFGDVAEDFVMLRTHEALFISRTS